MHKNLESLDLFFSTLDEETMELLIEIYEKNDIKALETFIEKSKLTISKKDLMEGMAMLKEMKPMMGDFFE